MKRLNKIILSIFLIFSSGCKKDENKDKFLLEGSYEATSYISIDLDELEYKLDEEESFVLYIYTEGCSSCNSFTNDVLNPFIEETKSIIYGIDSAIMDKNVLKYSTNPTIIIIKNGKALKTTNYKKSNKIFSSLNEFKDFIKKYVNYPNMLTISEANLDNKIKNNDSFILYVGWNKCGDCKLLQEEVLNDYLNKDSFTEKIYYLEADPYRNGRKNSLEDCTTQEEIDKYNAWLAFASKYNFNTYQNGKIPALVYYKNGVFIELLVYHNDTITNGVVKESFFSEIKNTKMNEKELIDYHNQKALEFLNKYYR